jgi:hypothetical protein
MLPSLQVESRRILTNHHCESGSCPELRRTDPASTALSGGLEVSLSFTSTQDLRDLLKTKEYINDIDINDNSINNPNNLPILKKIETFL